MSVSKYAYTQEFCDGVFCIGDCDLCGLRNAEIDEENMTLEEAITHALEVADSHGCTECGENHRQLASWLEELRERRKRDDCE